MTPVIALYFWILSMLGVPNAGCVENADQPHATCQNSSVKPPPPEEDECDGGLFCREYNPHGFISNGF